jgi:DNA-binding transcriptional regulator YiaG
VTHLDVDPSAPVTRWPTEGLITALERGGLSDWRRIVAEVEADPWGLVARRLEDALAATDAYGSTELLRTALLQARAREAQRERDEVADRVRRSLEASGMRRAEFAEAIGTSQSRLSTHLSGRVAPSSTLLVRMERVAALRRGGAPPAHDR